MLGKMHNIMMIIPFFLSACEGEHFRATRAALAAYQGKNARLLTFVPQVSEDCHWGCYTEICAVLELENKDIALRQVVFIRVSGMDDDQMYVRGEYPSLVDCRKNFDK